EALPDLPRLGELSDEERKVAELVRMGLKNREIAERIFVSLRTVELRLTAVYRKLDVGSRTELVSRLAGNPRLAAVREGPGRRSWHSARCRSWHSARWPRMTALPPPQAAEQELGSHSVNSTHSAVGIAAPPESSGGGRPLGRDRRVWEIAMTVSEHPDPLTRTGASAAPPMAGAARRVWRTHPGLPRLFDASAWILAGLLAATVMSGGIATVELGIALAASVALQLVLGLLIGVYRSRFHYGSFSEYGGIAIISLVIACALMAVTFGHSPFVLLTVLSAVILMTGSRYVVRWSHQIATRPLQGQRVLVVGAGAAAESLIRQMLSDPDGAYLPVGLIDDDPRKRHLSIHGVRVRGTSE